MLRAFEGWVGPRNPKILFVGEAWGAEEEPVRQPFVGESGKEFWRMLGEAFPETNYSEHQRVADYFKYGSAWIKYRQDWMHQSSIAFTNVLNLRPPDNKIPALCVKKAELPSSYEKPSLTKGLYLHPDYLPEVERLEEEIETSSPNLIVALGNTACWAILNATNISSIRGNTTLSTNLRQKVLPTYHPAGVLYNWPWRPIVVADLMKARREGEFPDIRRPQRQLLISPTIEEWRDFVNETLKNPPDMLTNDTETTAGMIDTVGFATSRSYGIVCMVGPHRIRRGNHFEYIWPVRDGKEVTHYFSADEELFFWRLNFQLLESPIPKLFQNGLYDVQYWNKMGCHPNNVIEDTMLLSHSIWPEMRKSLGFLGSIFTDEASWKLMHRHKGDSEKRDE